MTNNEQIKELQEKLINLSNELEQSDGELLDLILNETDKQTIKATINKLEEWKLTEKIRKYFNLRAIDSVKKTPNGYENEYTIHETDKTTNIEIASRASAISNELDFITSIEEKNKFLIQMAQTEILKEIGAYKRIDVDLYYKEF